MRKLILIAGVAAAVAAPALASAQTSCERARGDRRAVGTIAGGVLGALAGSAIASRHDSTAGILVGGAAGAYAGNQLTKGSPCPPGYVRSYYVPRRTVHSTTTRRVASAPSCSWRDQTYRDSYGSIVHRQVQVCR